MSALRAYHSDHDYSTAANETVAMLEAQAIESAAWLAARHRDGIVPPAEKIVLDALRALQAIPQADRLYADQLMDVIAKGLLDTASSQRASCRRARALLRIAGGLS